MQDQDHQKCQLFINGEWVDPAEKGRFEVLDPGKEEVIAEVEPLTCEQSPKR